MISEQHGSHVSIATGIVWVGATAPGIGSAGLAGRSGPRGRQLVCIWHAAHSVISIAIPGVVALGIHTARIAGKSGYEASSHGQGGYRHQSVSHGILLKCMVLKNSMATIVSASAVSRSAQLRKQHSPHITTSVYLLEPYISKVPEDYTTRLLDH